MVSNKFYSCKMEENSFVVEHILRMSCVGETNHLWGHKDPFYVRRGVSCMKSRSSHSTQRIFMQVQAVKIRNTLVLLYPVICVFLSS